MSPLKTLQWLPLLSGESYHIKSYLIFFFKLVHGRPYNEDVIIYLTTFLLIDVWLVANFWLLPPPTRAALDTRVFLYKGGYEVEGRIFKLTIFVCTTKLACKWPDQFLHSHFVNEGFPSHPQHVAYFQLNRKKKNPNFASIEGEHIFLL